MWNSVGEDRPPGMERTNQASQANGMAEPNDQYRIVNDNRKTIVRAAVAISVVLLTAVLAYVGIRALRQTPEVKGSVRVDSVPRGATVLVDGTKLSNVTPLEINNLLLGSAHDLRIELGRHKPYTTVVTIPTSGGMIPVTALLTPMTGTLRVSTTPPGADLYINGQLRNRTPCIVTDVDVASVRSVELRLKDYQPSTTALTWPESGELDVSIKLTK
jgi:hypothetical protein